MGERKKKRFLNVVDMHMKKKVAKTNNKKPELAEYVMKTEMKIAVQRNV